MKTHIIRIVTALFLIGFVMYVLIQQKDTFVYPSITVYIGEDGDQTEVDRLSDVRDVIPGQEIPHSVTFRNTSTRSLYMRVRLSVALDDPELPADHILTYEADTDHWYYVNGYYYYKEKLSVGETTQPLLKSVKLSESVDNQYLNHDVLLTLQMYVVQSEGNGETPWLADGFPAESGG